MGRTIESFRQVVKEEYGSLEKFKRALRRQDQLVFEEMLLSARLHTQAGSYASFLDPFDAIVLGILLEQEKKLRRFNNESKPY